MCGIIGTVSPARASGRPLELATIGHRGPDAYGQEQVGPALLGHTRLSIIDLGSGSQPMSDVGGAATIVFNGEIYNYRELRGDLEARGCRFQSASDTEVILNAYLAWGVQGFARLRGMYAFAIGDRRDGSTIIARDPFGIKPLFFHQSSDSLHFASELDALVRLVGSAPRIDLSSVLETLVHRYPVGEHTLYQGFQRLQPGTALVIPSGSAQGRLVSFARLAELIEAERESAGRASADEIFAEVSNSVKHHAISDVPVGCFLSGGLDSSIVAAQLAQDLPSRLQAFSVSFHGASTERSELPFARAVANHIGADLHEVVVSAQDFTDLAPALSGSLNGPFPDPADIAMLKLSRTAARHVKVVLSGEGSDEAFGGYPKYAADRYASLARPFAAAIGPALERRGRLGIAAHALAEGDRSRRWMRWFQNDDISRATVNSLIAQGAKAGRALHWVEDRVAGYPGDWSNLQRMQLLDLESWLPNNLLHRGDYTTMQASLEQRVPFLDARLTPWAVALPDRLKVRGLKGKHALRRAFAAKLPPQVLKRPKSGFRLPLGEWLKSDPGLRSLMHDHLLSPNASVRTVLGMDRLDAVLTDGALSTTGGAKLAWTALSLELWLTSLRSHSSAT